MSTPTSARDNPAGEGLGPALRVALATAVFAAAHSAFASRRVKAAVAARAGTRARNGLYRVGYNAQAVVTTALLVAYIVRQPNRTWYEVTGPAAWFLRLGQAAGVLMLIDGVLRVGVLKIAGLSSAAEFVRGDREVSAEPEAQGPSLGLDGRVNASGMFRWSRHPLNLAPLPILWLNPRMTRNLAVFSSLASIYFVVGSLHEETRLEAAYPHSYAAYLRSGVAFYLPDRLPRRGERMELLPSARAAREGNRLVKW